MSATNHETSAQPAVISTRVDAWLGFAVLTQGLVLASFSINALDPAKSQIEGALRVSEEQVYISYNAYTVTPPTQIEWSTYGYMLAFMLAMPVCTWLVRRIGHSRTCIAAMLLFGAGSLGVALSGSQVFRLVLDMNWLLGWRVAQAFGGGAFLPLAVALTPYLYTLPETEPYSAMFFKARSWASATEVAIYLIVPITSLFGFLYSTKVLEALGDWFWIPLLNVLFSLAAITLLSATRLAIEHEHLRLDWFGWALLIIFLCLFTIALNYHPTTYTNAPRIVQEYLTP